MLAAADVERVGKQLDTSINDGNRTSVGRLPASQESLQSAFVCDSLYSLLLLLLL